MVSGTYPIHIQYITVVEYDLANNPIYVGEALPGTATSDNKWRIKRITFDPANNPTAVEWAENAALFDKVWDDRAAYSYG